MPLESKKVSVSLSMCLGIPGQITAIVNPDLSLAKVNIAGVERVVNIACIVDEQHPPATCLGEWVLVHVGFALNRLSATEAEETLQLLDQLTLAAELIPDEVPA